MLHRRFQAAFHVHQDPFLVRVVRHRLEQRFPRHGVEEFPHVQVDDPVVRPAPLAADLECLALRAGWSVSERVPVEHRLDLRLQDQLQHRLRYAIYHVGNT